MRRISLTTRPAQKFTVPEWTGYSLYSALLSSIQDLDADASKAIHDRDFGSLHNSGVIGDFGSHHRKNHKSILPRNTYTIELGVTDPLSTDIFDAIFQATILDESEITLTNGELEITEFQSKESSHEEIISKAGQQNAGQLQFTFETPTCITDGKDRTCMFPHRTAVFTSLQHTWNQSCPDKYEFGFSAQEIRNALIEKPNGYNLESHSVVENRVPTGDSESDHTKAIFKQGFTGDCTYQFKDASESMQNALTTLALFSEYAGVGSATARGCGTVNVELN